MQEEEDGDSGKDFKVKKDHRLEQWFLGTRACGNTSCWAPPLESDSSGAQELAFLSVPRGR